MTLAVALMNLMLIAAGILFLVLPKISRPGILFGVTVAPDFSGTSEGQALLRQYRRSVAIATITILIVSNVGALVSRAFIVIAVLLEGVAALASWARASRQTRPFAQQSSSIRAAILTAEGDSIPGGWLFLLGPFLVLGVAAWVLYANWSSIPERFAVHWSLGGTPDGWSRRSFGGVFGFLVLGAVPTIVSIFIACLIALKTRSVSQSEEAAEGQRAFRRATFFVIMMISYVISTVNAVLATRPVWAPNPDEMPRAVLPLVLLVVLGCSGASVFYLARISSARKPSVGDGTPDSYWKWGLVYYNPDDPAIFVEKRVGLGWTLNFARKSSWLLLILPLLGPFVILAVLAKFG